jgi:pseudouridine-5'-phosphate glycosidase
VRGRSLTVSPTVTDALHDGRGVVALETSVIGQGLPVPRNGECVERMGAAITDAGAVPAWVGVVAGSIVVGLSDAELDRFASSGTSIKVARRDLPAAVSADALGATTVSAMIWAAASAGITVMATGGIGGVHPGESADVSADLLELARTPGLLVCSGPKSILDPVATAEKLDELGIAVVGIGVDRLPFFLAREAPVDLDHRVDGPDGAAAVLRASLELGVGSMVLACNPVPEASALGADEIADAAREAERRAGGAGIKGKDRTPFLLSALAEITEGRSLEANLALLEDNARVAADIAVVAAAGR